ncbi:uncharacterized protein LOC122816484 isoform X2 [Protopterus annectens]|uniref:uncharacterized protein LOC122816484 isoform X2 n=1 Tax=Protopterus annectens TaxID=7888 RepID=UPI001CFAFA58|nr:uncharacterized protein LOC122816484 isoform X2 [Protopterus annectens]
MAAEVNMKKSLNMKGFLEKRRQTLKFHWRLYKFLLEGSVLSYYKMQNEDGKEIEKEGILWGKIDLRYVQSVRKATSVSHNFPFEVVLYNGKTIILSAQSEAKRTEWLQALWKVMHLSGQEERNCRSLTSDLHSKDSYMTHSSDEDNCEDSAEKKSNPRKILPRARIKSDLCVTSEKEGKMSESQNRKHVSLGFEQTSITQASCNSVSSYDGVPSPAVVISSTKMSALYTGKSAGITLTSLHMHTTKCDSTFAVHSHTEVCANGSLVTE